MASARLAIKILECPVCLNPYDLRDRIPKALRCIHTVCNACLDSLIAGKDSVSCPTCRKDCAVSDIAKNYTVVDILEALCEGCMTEERQELCHHCKKHLCKACLDEHAKNFHAVVKENLQVLVQQVIKANELSFDQSALEKERKQEEDVIDDIKKAIQYHKDELDKLEKELEKQVKQKKEINQKKQVNWREKLDSKIAEAKLCIDKSENTLGTKYLPSSCTTEAMSAVHEECQQLLAELQKAKDEVPMLCPYKFEADLTVPTVGRVVWTAEKYKMARYKRKFGSLGSGREEFNEPVSVACTDRHIIVTDTFNHRIKVYDHDLNLQTVFGQKGKGREDFNHPWCVCVGPNEELYVTDPGNNRVKVCDVDGKIFRVIGEATNEKFKLNLPTGIAIKDNKQLVIFNKDKITVLDTNGRFIRNIGNQENAGLEFVSDTFPKYVHVQNDNILVTVHNQNTITVIDNGDNVQKRILYPTELLSELNLQNPSPSGMTEDSSGNLIIADEMNHRLVVHDKEGDFVCTIGKQGAGDGELSEPTGVCVCPNGDILVADSQNHRLQLFEIQLGEIMD